MLFRETATVSCKSYERSAQSLESKCTVLTINSDSTYSHQQYLRVDAVFINVRAIAHSTRSSEASSFFCVSVRCHVFNKCAQQELWFVVPPEHPTLRSLD